VQEKLSNAWLDHLLEGLALEARVMERCPNAQCLNAPMPNAQLLHAPNDGFGTS
jgi:hypothetical protein